MNWPNARSDELNVRIADARQGIPAGYVQRIELDVELVRRKRPGLRCDARLHVYNSRGSSAKTGRIRIRGARLGWVLVDQERH